MSLQKCFFLTDSYNPNEPEDEWTLVYEKTTSGSDTFNVGWGKYKIEISAGGGGGGVAYSIYGQVAGASGGAGAYGSVIFEYTENETDTLSFTIGAHGTGAIKSQGTAATTGGGSTTVSDTIHGSNFVTLNGGAGGYAHAKDSSKSASVGTGGTFSTTLTTHNFNSGTNGIKSTTSPNQTSGSTYNAAPFDTGGYGGGFSITSGSSAGYNGGDGFIRIYKSQVYPKAI